MATKRIRKRLVAQVRLADGSDGERVFRSLADAKAWVTARGAVLVDHRWREETVWRGRVTDLDGHRREQIFETKGAAVAWEKEMEAALEQGFDPELGKRSLRSWHAERLKGRPAEAPSAASRSRDAGFWKGHIEPAFGSRSLASIRRNDVKGFAVSLMGDTGLDPKTVKRVVGLLAIMLDEAIEHGLLRSNPARGLRLKDPVEIIEPRRKPKSRAVLSRDQVYALADAVPVRFRAVVMAGCLGGLRFEEIAGLRWSNVHLESFGGKQPRIRVEEVLVEVDGRLHRQVPKVGKRVVEIPPELVAELRAHLEEFGPGPGDLVFTAERGGSLRRNNFAKRILGPTARRVVGKWISPHDMRRSCGSMMIAAGVDVVSAAAYLGDKVETFLAHYADELEGGMAVALERFSSYLSGAASGAEFGAVTTLAGAGAGHEIAG